MCQLMGMSANVPTDAQFSFTGLVQRAGATDVHSDGWGISFYRGKGVQEFRDLTAGSQCQVARFLKQQSIKADIVIGHIRQANVGALVLENTHPFRRELWGKHFTFAHNGQIQGIQQQLQLQRFMPVGTTDSEHIFCWLMGKLDQKFEQPPTAKQLSAVIFELTRPLHRQGVCNFLLTDGDVLIAHCSNNLHWITRKAPFGKAELVDIDVTIDFSTVTQPTDVVTVIATQPLTANEQWQKMQSEELLVFQSGSLLHRFTPNMSVDTD